MSLKRVSVGYDCMTRGRGWGEWVNNMISNTWYLIPHWPSVVYRGISTSIRQFTCQLTTLSVTWPLHPSLDHLLVFSVSIPPHLQTIVCFEKVKQPLLFVLYLDYGRLSNFLEYFQIFERYSGFRKIFRFLAKSQKLELWFARCKCETQQNWQCQ